VRLISELNRRNVLRMAGVYLVVAWATIQVADVLIGMLDLPDWIGRGLIIVLATGFPIALLISWFYEITPQGITAEKDIPTDDRLAHAANRRVDFIIIGVLLATVILFATDKWWPRGPDDLSVAVLAFENMSNNPDQEWFSDGVSEEIRNLLAGIEALKVIARTSSLSFKGKDVAIAEIAEDLNVRHILEGSVRRYGDQVRITAHLIDAADSTRLWSRTFDRPLTAKNFFFIQSEIARAIANQLRITLDVPNEERLARSPTDNMDAYDAYMLGRNRLRDSKIDGLAEAAEQFALAIKLDPDYAAAYAGLADACDRYARATTKIHPDCPPAEAPRYAQDLLPFALRALELDNNCAEAWITYADLIGPEHVRAKSDRIDEVTAAYERGLALNPALSDAYLRYAGFLFSHARSAPGPGASAEEERKAAEKAWQNWQEGSQRSVVMRGLEKDPRSLQLHSMASGYPLIASTPEEAMHHARRMVEIAPYSTLAYERLAYHTWQLEGRVDEAIKWRHKAAEIDPKAPGIPNFLGRAYRALGDFEMASAYLRKAKQMLSPEASELWLLDEALLHLYAGRRDAAIELLEQMQDRSMRGAYVHVPLRVLAGLDLKSGDAKRALARYQEHQPQCFGREEGVKRFEACPMFGLTRVYQELGNDEWGREVIQEWLDNGGAVADHNFRPLLGSNSVVFDRTARLALTGKSDEALDFLEEGVQQGWRGGVGPEQDWRYFVYYDISVDAIRDDPRFQAAISIIEKDMAGQLENVREMERRGEIPSLEDLQASLNDARE